MKQSRDWSHYVLYGGALLLVSALLQSLLTPRVVRDEMALHAPRMIQEALTKPPAMVVHSVVIEETSVARGTPLHVTYTYDKRPECTPELGTGRHIWYAFIDQDRFWTLEPFKLADREPSGLSQIATAQVETASLPPGQYYFQMMSRFSCSGEPSERVVRSEPVPFNILPRA